MVIIVIFFWIGLYFGKAEQKRLEESIKIKIKKFAEVEDQDARIFKSLKLEKAQQSIESHNFVSIMMVVLILWALIIYMSDINDIIPIFDDIELRWRQIMLFLLNIYYSFPYSH